MTKTDLIAALERIHGNPEISVDVVSDIRDIYDEDTEWIIDRVNEIPRPEIVVIKK